MKNITYLIIIALAVVSCKKDDESRPSNYIEVKNSIYEIKSANLFKIGSSDYKIWSLSDGHVEFVDSIYDFSSTGKVDIYLSMVNDNNDELPNGQYDYVADSVSDDYTFTGYYIYKIDSTHRAIFEIDSGTVIYSGSDANAKIELFSRFNKKQKLNAYYNGRIDTLTIMSPF